MDVSARGRAATTMLWGLIAVLAATIVFLLVRDDPAPELDASTDKVTLPDEVGAWVAHTDDEMLDDVEFDWDQTRQDYAEVLGANLDYATYWRADAESDSDDDSLNDPIVVAARVTRAELPLTPGYTTENSSTRIVRDDMICELASYTVDADAEQKQRPQTCTRSDDGLTVTLSATDLVTSETPDAPNIDELVTFTDQVYDAAK